MNPIAIALAIGLLTGPAQGITGQATWYDAPSIHDAAAGPALRSMLGAKWRGRWVAVTAANGRSVTVQLTDYCACKGRRIVDLDDRAFAKLAPLSKGVIEVTVETVEGTLPQTDTE